MMIVGPKSYEEIFSEFPSADALVIAMPIYIDAVPSHVLKFLTEAEKICRERNLKFRLYVIANCGFYEGRQTRRQFAVMRCWCRRAGIGWGGGVGVGAGEMLSCLRLIPIIGALNLLARFVGGLISLASKGAFSVAAATAGADWVSFLIDLLVFFLFCSGLFTAIWRLGRHVKKRAEQKDLFTGLMFCPKFVFLFFANLFWIIRAAFHGVGLWKMFRRPRAGAGAAR